MNKKILFLSGIYPKEFKEYVDQSINKNVQNAANVLQWHLINGIEKNINRSIDLINAPFMGVYPKSSRILYNKKRKFKHNPNANDINIPFLNLPIWRQISIFFNSCLYIKKWVKENPDGIVISYALTLRNVYRLLYVKQINRGIKTCMIVPDLPMYMRPNGSKFYFLMKSMEAKLIKRKLNQIDGFVLLTEGMNEYIDARKYCVMEGIATEQKVAEYEIPKEKNILYAGTLDSKYGIRILLSAFQQTANDEYKLLICGSGECVDDVKKASENDSRIQYLGLLKHEDVLKYQRKASVLINPRQNTERFTKYSFPSKNLEYLSTGIPLIAYKLDGIPSEYDNYILYVKDNTVEALRDKIVEVLEYTEYERMKIGERAREFVLKEKSEILQTDKILKLIDEL